MYVLFPLPLSRQGILSYTLTRMGLLYIRVLYTVQTLETLLFVQNGDRQAPIYTVSRMFLMIINPHRDMFLMFTIDIIIIPINIQGKTTIPTFHIITNTLTRAKFAIMPSITHGKFLHAKARPAQPPGA